MLFVHRDGNAIYDFQKERKTLLRTCCYAVLGHSSPQPNPNHLWFSERKKLYRDVWIEDQCEKATTLKSPTLVLKRIVVRSLKRENNWKIIFALSTVHVHVHGSEKLACDFDSCRLYWHYTKEAHKPVNRGSMFHYWGRKGRQKGIQGTKVWCV